MRVFEDFKKIPASSAIVLTQCDYDIRSVAGAIIQWHKRKSRRGRGRKRLWLGLSPWKLTLLLYRLQASCIYAYGKVPFSGNFVIGSKTDHINYTRLWHPDLNLTNNYIGGKYAKVQYSDNCRTVESVCNGWSGVIRSSYMQEQVEAVCSHFLGYSDWTMHEMLSYLDPEYKDAMLRASKIKASDDPAFANLYVSGSYKASSSVSEIMRGCGVPGISDLRFGPMYYSYKWLHEMPDRVALVDMDKATIIV